MAKPGTVATEDTYAITEIIEVMEDAITGRNEVVVDDITGVAVDTRVIGAIGAVFDDTSQLNILKG